MENSIYNNPRLREVYQETEVLRKPITGIVSDYHELPYILVAPSSEGAQSSIEVTGRIMVSPRLVISAAAASETFGEVFDPATFNADIVGRLFSFVYGRKNLKVQSDRFSLREDSSSATDLADRILDRLLREEDTGTALIRCPQFDLYPVSIDRFISEIVHREFRV